MDRRIHDVLMALTLLLLGASCTSKIKALGGPLGAPTNLSGQLVSGAPQIQLAWTRNSTAETGFRVDISTKPIVQLSDVTSFTVLAAGSTAYTYPVPSIGPTYYFRVLAVTATLESNPSNVCGVQTVVGPPATPPGVTAAGISSSDILVNWVDVGGASNYVIERTSDHGTTWTPIITLGSTASSYDDSGLLANTGYCYRVTATNSAGGSAPSPMVCAQTLCANQTSTTVYNSGNAGLYTSIALAGSTEYISHYDATNTRVLCTAGGSTVVTDSGPTPGSVVGSDGTSIALSGTSIVTTQHHTRTGSTPVNKVRTASSLLGSLSFTSSILDTNSYPSGGFPKVAYDPFNGNFIYLYSIDSGGALSLSWWNAAFSQTNSADPTSCSSYSGTALAIDAQSSWHAAFTHTLVGQTTTELVYGYKPATALTFGLTTLITTGNPTDVSITTEINSSNQGIAHIAYYESATGRLIHAWRPDLLVFTPWRFEVVDSTTSTDVGAYNSIALSGGTGGRLHISYYDRVNGDLRYARKDGNGPWVLLLIDAQGNVGTYTSIAAESNGTVHIAYRDETNQALKVASGTP